MSWRKAAQLATGVLVAVAVVAALTTTGGRWLRSAPPDLESQRFTASNGRTSLYHLYRQGVPTDEPAGLLVHFHGDGAYEFHNPDSDYSLGGPDGVIARGEENDMLVLAALSPDRRGTVTWWEQGRPNADYARELIQQVALDQYDIDTTDIWLVGYSGGAQFITQFFLPEHADLLDGGGSIVFGGGGPPLVEPRPFSESLKRNFRMHWYTGEEDTGTWPEWYDALSQARDGEQWYRRHGFRTTIETPPGVGHDGLPFGRVVGRQLADDRSAPGIQRTP